MPLYDEILVRVVAELDVETFSHCRRVQSLAVALGKEMGLTTLELKHLGLGAFLHDIGKRFIPQRILSKQNPLTSAEWEIIKLHPHLGYECAELIGLSNVVQRIIREHHLWANGLGGYPLDENRTEPCLLAQITTVADVVDAMTNSRPYRPALSVSACLEYLEEHAGSKFNKDVVDIFKTQFAAKVCFSEVSLEISPTQPGRANGR